MKNRVQDAIRPDLPASTEAVKQLDPEQLAAKIAHYSDQLMPDRLEKLFKTASQRTRQYCLVLEDLRDPHNISAIIRSCEVFGLLDVHIIEEVNAYTVSPAILRGSIKWMQIHTYKKRAQCLANLKSQGYRIAVASTHATQSIHEVDLSSPTAFYMGSELLGNHEDTVAVADVLFKIPQYGLTESLNVSVCAGVLLAHLDRYMCTQGRDQYCLNGRKLEELKLQYLMRSAEDVSLRSCVERHGE